MTSSVNIQVQKTETLKKMTQWDTSEFLQTGEDIAAYLAVSFEEDDPEAVKLAIGNVAKARGMLDIARKTGMNRENFYNSFIHYNHKKFTESEAICLRNQKWQKNKHIPTWVDLKTVGLEQFFTKPEIAKKCLKTLMHFLNDEKININDYTFIEPSAGNGEFYKLLRGYNRIGFDIMPLCEGVVQQDFLSWFPDARSFGELFGLSMKDTDNYICVGNPPFGYRAWLALAFMRHASLFSDYIGMILPMSFQSEGKGNPRNRINNMQLVYSETLPSNSFYTPHGEKCSINALFQIWKKGQKIQPPKKTCGSWVDIFTVDLRKERLCGMSKIQDADYFIQRTYYDIPPKLVKNFSDVKYVCGYGLIFKKEKATLKKILDGVDWNQYSNLAAHNCHHISMYHIEKALTDRGYFDD